MSDCELITLHYSFGHAHGPLRNNPFDPGCDGVVRNHCVFFDVGSGNVVKATHFEGAPVGFCCLLDVGGGKPRDLACIGTFDRKNLVVLADKKGPRSWEEVNAELVSRKVPESERACVRETHFVPSKNAL